MQYQSRDRHGDYYDKIGYAVPKQTAEESFHFFTDKFLNTVKFKRNGSEKPKYVKEPFAGGFSVDIT